MKLVLSLLFAAVLAFADGGAVLFRQQSGPFLVTVFGSPQVGSTDFSVLVQNASDRSPMLDAEVSIAVAHQLAAATHAQATNKLLYATSIRFFRPGEYSLQVRVAQMEKGGAYIDHDIVVSPTPAPWLAYWPCFALVPVAILLFALNQWLKSKRTQRPPAPP
ncbi:MAG: hypothetical protein JO340_20935 [Acidobacteriaceae bacterium]|nr:hypothetical protein [Acidobacteriaceae bacterium]